MIVKRSKWQQCQSQDDGQLSFFMTYRDFLKSLLAKIGCITLVITAISIFLFGVSLAVMISGAFLGISVIIGFCLSAAWFTITKGEMLNWRCDRQGVTLRSIPFIGSEQYSWPEVQKITVYQLLLPRYATMQTPRYRDMVEVCVHKVKYPKSLIERIAYALFTIHLSPRKMSMIVSCSGKGAVETYSALRRLTPECAKIQLVQE